MANSHLVFVYGSLKRGERNHAVLQASEYRGEARTECRFRLYAFPAYPALVRDDNNPLAILGELYSVDDRTLRSLDRLEENGRLYQRELLPVEPLEPPGETLAAWTYLFLGPLDGAIACPGPQWTGTRGTRRS